MKRFSLLFLITILASPNLKAQDPAKLKEHYDYIHPAYGPATYSYTNCSHRGNGLSWTLMSLLNMYKTTGDKDYLVKFINYTIHLQQYRYSSYDGNIIPLWVGPNDDGCDGTNGNAEPAYFNYLLLKPMSEFVNMVITEPSHELYNTSLPIHPYIDPSESNLVDLGSLSSLPPFISVVGYGDFARWLGYRVEESVMYINAYYWDDTYGVKDHEFHRCSNINGTCGAGMNMASAYGCTLLNMGFCSFSNAYWNFGFGTNQAVYQEKAQVLAAFLRGSVSLYEHCDGGRSYNNNEIIYKNSTDSYWWYTRAMSRSRHTCNLIHQGDDDIEWYTEFKEDVAHGAMDLWFITDLHDRLDVSGNHFAPCNVCTPYILDSDMQKLSNTFRSNIYFPDINGGHHFHNNLDGTDFDNSQCSTCPSDYNWGEVMGWMPVYPYDNGNPTYNGDPVPSTYDILLEHTTRKIQNGFTYFSGPQSYQGFTEIVKAQWREDCINLSLYKRKLIYNQNFEVKNKIIVEPNSTDQYNSASSFANPIVNTTAFTIEPNVTSNMTAGEEITFKPGFNAKSGCNFTASINSNICSDGRSMTAVSTNNNFEKAPPVLAPHVQNSPAIKPVFDIEVFPNPNNGTFQITAKINNKEALLKEVKIYDLFGKEIWSTESPNSIFNIDISEYSDGIYYLRTISLEGEIKLKKLVKG